MKRTLSPTLVTCAVVGVMGLSACGGADNQAEQGVAPAEGNGSGSSLGSGDAPTDLEQLQQELEDAYDELQQAYDELPEEFRGTRLSAGDCWGYAESANHHPRACSEPHVYEVVGVFDDFDADQFSAEGVSALDAARADGEARQDLCEQAFADYFGVEYSSTTGIDLEPTPFIVMEPNIVVCSASEGRRTEVEGSFQDRGLP